MEKLKENGIFQEVQAVSPGFINLKLSGDYLAEYLKQMQADENLSVEKAEHPKKIIPGLRRTKRGKTAACRTSAFCDHR